MFTVILYHAKGCHHCEELHPKFDEIVREHQSDLFDFQTRELNELGTLDSYRSVIPKGTTVEIYTDEAGNELKRLKRDANNKVIYESPLEFPNTVFLQNGRFMGNIVGNNPDGIRMVINGLKASLQNGQ